MFGFSRKEKEAEAIRIMLGLFMDGFNRATYRVASQMDKRYSNWWGSSWDERYLVVIAGYASAIRDQNDMGAESYNLALKQYCVSNAYGGRGEAMFHRTQDENLLMHYKNLFAYVYELADVVRVVPDGGSGIKLGCSEYADLDTVLDVFVEKYFSYPPVLDEFNLKSNVRYTPL